MAQIAVNFVPSEYVARYRAVSYWAEGEVYRATIQFDPFNNEADKWPGDYDVE